MKESSIYKTASLIFRCPGEIGFEKDYDDCIFLVGTPLHKNLGDHLIAEAEMQFLKDCFPDKRIVEVPTEVFLKHQDFLKRTSPERAFITGGGWMGSLWPDDERIMQKMVETFSKVTILPQTIYYDSDSELLESANKRFRECRSLKLCVRDEQSYEFAVKNMDAEVYLAPDMALYYKGDHNFSSNKGTAGLYLRKDREQVTDEAMLSDILEPFNDYSFVVSDTMYRRLVPKWRRSSLIRKTINDMRGCEVIITDRLHAMVYSVIAGTKCIALDNKTGKVSGVYSKWLDWNPNILLIKDSDDPKRIKELMDAPLDHTDYSTKLKPAFDTLKEIIKED